MGTASVLARLFSAKWCRMNLQSERQIFDGVAVAASKQGWRDLDESLSDRDRRTARA